MKVVQIYYKANYPPFKQSFPVGTTEEEIEKYFLQFIAQNSYDLSEAYWRYA